MHSSVQTLLAVLLSLTALLGTPSHSNAEDKADKPKPLQFVRGTAVIIPDETGKVAAFLQALLSKDGFKVTQLPWTDLSKARLSKADVDLLVLADARRVPFEAARLATSFLNGKGKLLVVGAPAFGELLLKTPHGYVTADRYPDALYGQLKLHPIAIESKDWKRNCRNKSRKGTIEAEETAWKITADVEGWDNFGITTKQLIPADHDVIAFRARGDATTPQLLIECSDSNGSRWMAKIEMTTKDQRYVLRPSDFSFWPNSSKGKRPSGGHINFANVTKLSFGLAWGLTPLCDHGLHTYWISDIATAVNPDRNQPAAIVPPNIDTISPSYQIYPLDDITAVAPVATYLYLSSGFTFPGAATITMPFVGKGYAAMPRETGIGFNRQRFARQVRVLDAFDSTGRNRGPIAWIMIGDTRLPGSIWGSMGLTGDLLEQFSKYPIMAHTFTAMAQSMNRGCFLLEVGTQQFSYRAKEPIEYGALVINAGRKEQRFSIHSEVSNDNYGELTGTEWQTIQAGERRDMRWKMNDRCTFPCQVSMQLSMKGLPLGQVIDTLSHSINLLPDQAGQPDDFVTIKGSNFSLHEQPWFMRGINYWPNREGGRNGSHWLYSSYYDPELVERDLIQMEAAGINFLSGIQGVLLSSPNGKGSLLYNNLHDFLDRCLRHKMRVFYTVPGANPMVGGNIEAFRQHVDAAQIKNHPAILAWELSWEPVYYSGTLNGGMDFLLRPWNAWIVERYGSLASAERDWGQKIPRVNNSHKLPPQSANSFSAKAGQKAIETPDTTALSELGALPAFNWLDKSGPWDRVVAAFRRFFSDYLSRAYGDLTREIRHYDDKHLISFRFGACSIPDKARFAHAHSAGVVKHIDFCCPEGYSLTPDGPAKPADVDELRKGGLTTLYYRFLSREKPVVWMEFGVSVNGMHTPWHTGMEHVRATELQRQQYEYSHYYQMFVESGARGAAPWWFPGGYRLTEFSDFGLVNPDGTPRPAFDVVRKYSSKFAQVGDDTCIAPRDPSQRNPRRPVIMLDLDAHHADAWDYYAPQYLVAVRAGHLPYLTTKGTGTTSADCPLLAVGNTVCNGQNPPQFLNAEFNSVECHPAAVGNVVAVKQNAVLTCRVSVGNLAEAKWLKPDAGQLGQEGRVYLSCAVAPSGKSIQVPIQADTDYLGDASTATFTVPLADELQQTVTLQMQTIRTTADGAKLTIPWGEKRTFAVHRLPD